MTGVKKQKDIQRVSIISRPGIQIPIPPSGVVLCDLIRGGVPVHAVSASSTGSLVRGWALVAKDRWYVLTAGQERAALGHSDFKKLAL